MFRSSCITVPPHDSNGRFSSTTGTGPQVKGNINANSTATQSGVLYSLKALFDPDVPNNQGLIDLVDIYAPPGCLINAKFPAAVAARANTCQRIVDVVIGALAPAIPEAAVGAANGANTTAVFFGHDPRHDRDYVYLETLGGGFGGRFSKDGKDGVQVHITNIRSARQIIEMEYPCWSKLRFRRVQRRRKISRWARPAPGGTSGRPYR
jgi:N-methylhydantoinase B